MIIPFVYVLKISPAMILGKMMEAYKKKTIPTMTLFQIEGRRCMFGII